MKKLLIMFAVVTAILAVSVIGASAAAGYIDDFSEPPVDGKVENYDNWNYYSATAAGDVRWENGMIRMERTQESSLIWDVATNLSNPVNFTVFDAKFNEIGAANNIFGYYYNSAERVSPSLYGFEPNVWYKIMFVSTFNPEAKSDDLDYGKYNLSIFVKKEGDEAWTNKGTQRFNKDKGAEGSKVRFNWSDKEGKSVGAVMYIDNIEAHDGLYWENLSLVDSNGTEINAGDEIAADATALTLNADIYDAMNLSTTMMTEPQTMNATSVLVAYDKDGMMLDCGIAEQEIANFSNSFSVTTDLSDYDKAEIDSIKLYFWDSMEGMLNVLEPVEFLKVTE